MIECEKLKVDNLVKEGTIKFYIRYADYTLLLVKCQDNDKVLKAFNWFDNNIKFTLDRFENETPHFMDLEICPNGLSIFQKTKTLDSTLTWTSLFCENGKPPGSVHLLIEHRTYVQKKTFQKNSN